jgi:Ohr subfamily peroxiredoxin
MNHPHLPDCHRDWFCHDGNAAPNLMCRNLKNPPKSRRHTMSVIAIEKVLYTAKAHTTGGREGGASRTSDGRLDVKLSVPGTPGTGTNPEQLFAVGWSACFLSAIKIVAGAMKVRLTADAAVDAEVDLGTANNGYFIQARLNVSLPGIEPAIAQQIVDGAHQQCPYSKATHGNINVVTTVSTAPVAHVA